MSAQRSANLDHHWGADTDGPKDDKDDIIAFRKFLIATLSFVYHDFRQLNIIPLFNSLIIFGGTLVLPCATVSEICLSIASLLYIPVNDIVKF